MKNFLTIALVALITMPLTAQAEKAQGSGPNPYTECGIGAAIFRDADLYWAAATSNVIWDLGTTAISSAISSPEMCNPKRIKTAKLILETLPQLEKDVALGEGEYITALMETAGCNSGHQGQVVSKMRASYKDSLANGYEAKTRVERATTFYNNTRDAMSSSQCNVVL